MEATKNNNIILLNSHSLRVFHFDVIIKNNKNKTNVGKSASLTSHSPPVLHSNRSRLVDHSMTTSTTTMLSSRLEAATTNNIILLTSHSLALRHTDQEQQKQDQWQQKQTEQCKKKLSSYFTSHSPPVLHSDRSRLVHSALFSPLNSKTILFSILNQSNNWSESIQLFESSY